VASGFGARPLLHCNRAAFANGGAVPRLRCRSKAVQKAPSTSDTPEPTQTPPGSQIPCKSKSCDTCPPDDWPAFRAKSLDSGIRSRVDTSQEATISPRLFIPAP
jgi:hypothetical protein